MIFTPAARAVALVSVPLMVVACAGTASDETETAPNVAATDVAASTTPDTTAVDGPDAAPADVPETAPVDVPDTAVDTVAPAGDATPRAAFGDADYLYAQDRLHTFEFTVPEASLAEIDADPTAEEYVEASMTFEGEEIGPVGLRYKGSVGSFIGCTSDNVETDVAGSKTCTKLSMKVKINWDGSDQEFYGVRRLQFHSHNLDPTHLHERLGYWLFDEMDIPTPRSTHARVVVNGELVGLFGFTEQIDGRFTRDRYDDGTGNLYKGEWPFGSTFKPTSEEDLAEALRTNEDDPPDFSIIGSFAEELVAAGPDGQRAVLEQRADLDDLLTYTVVDRTIRHDDGPFHWYCSETGCGNQNFYWYEDPSDRTVHLIPWDLDAAFENIGVEQNPYTGVADGWGERTADCEIFPYEELGRLQRSAACDPLFASLLPFEAERQAIIDEFLAGPFSQESVDARIDEWVELIQPAVAEAAALHADAISVEDWLAAVDSFRTDLATARAGLN